MSVREKIKEVINKNIICIDGTFQYYKHKKNLPHDLEKLFTAELIRELEGLKEKGYGTCVLISQIDSRIKEITQQEG